MHEPRKGEPIRDQENTMNVEPTPASKTENLRVLVVDDDPDMRGYLRSCLGRLGVVAANVAEAADGAEALEVVRRIRPDLVISDVVMRGVGGVALARALAEAPETRDIRVLLVTGSLSGLGEASAWAAESPERMLLAKPFNAQGLNDALEGLLHPHPQTYTNAPDPRGRRDERR